MDKKERIKCLGIYNPKSGGTIITKSHFTEEQLEKVRTSIFSKLTDDAVKGMKKKK